MSHNASLTHSMVEERENLTSQDLPNMRSIPYQYGPLKTIPKARDTGVGHATESPEPSMSLYEEISLVTLGLLGKTEDGHKLQRAKADEMRC